MISIIIRTLNEEKYLSELLEAIDDQAGMMFLASALKDAARTRASDENKSYHLQDDPDYETYNEAW